MSLSLQIDGFADGERIPDAFAFCNPDEMGPNRNPAISWSGAPAGTQSYALICLDPDAPSTPVDVNKEGRTVAADLPRAPFYHWVRVDIPAAATSIAEGVASDRVVPGGAPHGDTGAGVDGINDYTAWFSGDAEMEGHYGGYDGPCPPWNDERVHRYIFTVYALDLPTLGLSGRFTAAEALAAMAGHILEEASWTGTYTLNPSLR